MVHCQVDKWKWGTWVGGRLDPRWPGYTSLAIMSACVLGRPNQGQVRNLLPYNSNNTPLCGPTLTATFPVCLPTFTLKYY